MLLPNYYYLLISLLITYVVMLFLFNFLFYFFTLELWEPRSQSSCDFVLIYIGDLS